MQLWKIYYFYNILAEGCVCLYNQYLFPQVFASHSKNRSGRWQWSVVWKVWWHHSVAMTSMMRRFYNSWQAAYVAGTSRLLSLSASL